MPSRKVSALPAAATLTGAEVVPVVQAGASRKASLSSLVNDLDLPVLEAGTLPRDYRPDLDVINVKDRGVTGDGTTDDTAAIQAILSGLAHSTNLDDGANQRIYFPKGNYRITNTITGGNSLSHCIIQGDGQHSTEFVWDGTSGIPMFQFDNALNLTMRDLGVIGNPADAQRPSYGVRLHRSAGQVGSPSASKFHMINCWVGSASADSMQVGVAFTADSGFNANNDMATFDRTVIFNVWTGLWFSHTNALWNNVVNCYIAKCKTACISTVPDTPHPYGGSFQVRGGNFFTMPTEGTVFLAGPNNSGNTNDIVGMNIENSHQLLRSASPITTGVGGWRFFGGHANINDASPVGSVDIVDFDTTVADVEFHAVDIRQPSGSYLNFPGTGAKVSFFGGKVGLDVLKYNCRVAFHDTTVYGGSSTYTDLGSGILNWAGGTSNSTTTKGIEYPTLKASGLTGATSASRYVGSTTAGAPSTGTFTTGDWIVARDGFVWICTTGGSPGTWTRTGLRFPSGQTTASLAATSLTNGTFDTDLTGWTGANWVHNAGGAQHQAGATTALAQTIASGLTSGGYYQVTFTITGRTAGSVTFSLGSTTGSFTASDAATVTASGTSGTFSITPTTDFDGTISDVSLQRITASTPQLYLDTTAGSAVGEVRASTNQIGVGIRALSQNSTGTTNTALGADAVYRNVTGNANTGIGYRALRDNTDGNSNTAVGGAALQSNTVGLANTAVGVNSGLSNTTGNNNVAVGHSALNANVTGQAITAVGQQALTSATSGPNTAFGRSAGYAPNGTTANATTTGIRQTIVGNEAGQASATQRDHVVAVGDRALVDGSGAIAIGSQASAGAAGAVAIGRSSAGVAASTTTADEVKIGTSTHTYNLPGTKITIGTAGQTLTWGSGTPEGSVTGVVGSLHLRSDGSTGTTAYVKESGTGNTGWVAIGAGGGGGGGDADTLEGENGAHYLDRDNHTGDQLAATISDFATAVQLNRLDQMAAPTAAVSMGSQLVTNVADAASATDALNRQFGDARYPLRSAFPVTLLVAVSDETTALTAGTGKLSFRMPHAMTVTAVRASLVTASSSGVVTVDINEAGTTILSTKLTVDANETTSTTAATPAVISDTGLADDAVITIDIDTAGTAAAGLKVAIIGTRAL